ncbi:MAG TPA: hypothetical protein VH413_02040 [Verrucomicrobiae bacterium]|jgi:multisubunit Na+/H+ antiporter MnhB subunit|nr:hypothetical protein [Verrucomicrobiae bacterium]
MNGDSHAATILSAPSAAHARTRSCAPELLLVLAATSITIGIIWDISWHSSIGRDTFWTPAHMAIYLGGVLSGFTGGWLAIKHTFFPTPQEREHSVEVFGTRAPLGAWVAIWGAIAMITSAPFDDWWHNAYGLDVRIISPPHAVLGLGMFGISVAALLLAVSWQNQEPESLGGAMFVFAGGIFLTLSGLFIMEYTFPNLQHTSRFYEVCCLQFVIRLVAMGRAGRMSWPATRTALVYLLIMCLMIWILPLFPARPKLAPIFNPITHMVPPSFPALVVFPALGIDLILRKTGERDQGWRRVGIAVALGVAFLLILVAVQWFFSEFMLTPHANNWFFAGNRFWSFASGRGHWRSEFWHVNPGDENSDPLNMRGLGWSLLFATFSAWLGLLWGGWMKKVKR